MSLYLSDWKESVKDSDTVMNSLSLKLEILAHFTHPVNYDSSLFYVGCSWVINLTHLLSFYQSREHFVQRYVYLESLFNHFDWLRGILPYRYKRATCLAVAMLVSNLAPGTCLVRNKLSCLVTQITANLGHRSSWVVGIFLFREKRMHKVIYFGSSCFEHGLSLLLFLEGVEYIDVALNIMHSW